MKSLYLYLLGFIVFLSSCGSSLLSTKQHQLHLVKRNTTTAEYAENKTNKKEIIYSKPYESSKLISSKTVFLSSKVFKSTIAIRSKVNSPYIHSSQLKTKSETPAKPIVNEHSNAKKNKKDLSLSLLFLLLTVILLVLFSTLLMAEMITLALILGVLSIIPALLSVIFALKYKNVFVSILSTLIFLFSSGIALLSALILAIRAEN